MVIRKLVNFVLNVLFLVPPENATEIKLSHNVLKNISGFVECLKEFTS